MTADAAEEALKDQEKALLISKIYFQKNLAAPEAQDYIKMRGLSPAACRRFEVGYAPDSWRGLVDHYTSNKIRLAAVDAGLLHAIKDTKRLVDFFRDRIIFPIRNETGQLVGYGGRIVKATEDSRKYLNTPETTLFQKSELLYGFHQNSFRIKKDRAVVLVEGYTDVISLASNGFDFAAAPMGTALTSAQITLLLSSGVRNIYVGFDGDNAGVRASERSIAMIMEHYHPSLSVRVISYPDGHDPDSLIKEGGPQAFQTVLDAALPLDEFIHRLCRKGLPDNPCLEDKADYLSRMDGYLKMSSGTLQEKLLGFAAAFSGLSVAGVAEGKVDLSASSERPWDSMVAVAARWMLFADNRKQIAAHFSTRDATLSGVPELRAMAQDILADKPQSTKLAAFAQMHGAPAAYEVDQLKTEWLGWIAEVNLSDQMGRLQANSADEHAKTKIKDFLTPR